jgi:hypothetical protein
MAAQLKPLIFRGLQGDHVPGAEAVAEIMISLHRH